MNQSPRWVVLLVIISLISIFFFPSTSYANGSWLKYFRKDTLVNTYMRTYATIDDQLWVGTYGNGLVIYTGNRTKNLNNKNTRSAPNSDDGLLSDYVTSLAYDKKKGRLWIGTNEGVASCNLGGEEWQRYVDKDGIPNNVIRDLAVDHEGALWVGTPSGIARFNGEEWTTYTDKNGLNQNSVHSIKVEGNAVWVGTVGGSVSRFKDGSWKLFMHY